MHSASLVKSSLLAVCAIVLLAPADAHADEYMPASTKPFRLVIDVLSSLHLCNRARDYSLQLEKDSDNVTAMANLMNQNAKFSEAKAVMRSHIGDVDDTIALPAKEMTLALDRHIDANDAGVAVLRQISNQDPTAPKDAAYRLATILSAHKQAWEKLLQAAMLVTVAVVEPAQSGQPAGPIVFKISRQERLLLLRHLDEMFGENLARYYAYQDARRKGLAPNPYDSHYVVLSVDHIRRTLSATTYEDLRAPSQAPEAMF